VASSIGAFFAMHALQDMRIKKAYFISPIVDMENLIGVYEAKVFCDGCGENSKSTLILNADKTFKIDTVYQKKIAQRELQTGIYEIEGNTLSVTNQYREKLNFEINGDTLRQISNQNSFIKENFAQERIYKKLEAN
uniref:copper resistance protein NlpE N-terminal domain-containing protein n=1 Tax=Campylobacter concisus TaxID=199 RepID=UPI000CD9A434